MLGHRHVDDLVGRQVVVVDQPGAGAAQTRSLPGVVRAGGAGAACVYRRRARLEPGAFRRRYYNARRAGRQRFLHRGARSDENRGARSESCAITDSVAGRNIPVQHLHRDTAVPRDSQAAPWMTG